MSYCEWNLIKATIANIILEMEKVKIQFMRY